jgi:hypothetical protein
VGRVARNYKTQKPNCIICGKETTCVINYDNTLGAKDAEWTFPYNRWACCSKNCANTTIPIPLEDLGILPKAWSCGPPDRPGVPVQPNMKEYADMGLDLSKIE